MNKKLQKTSKKTRLHLMLLTLGVGLIVWSVAFKDKDQLAAVNEEDNQEEIVLEDNTAEKEYLEGTLYKSEYPKLGNFKLASDNQDIYIRTGRDFSNLVGLQVMVFIDGTTDNFKLVDIHSKLENNGYLLNQ